MARTSTTLRFALLITTACGFLDSYTYLARGGVFANAQTGNVILFAVDVTSPNLADAMAHLWPLLRFWWG
ncbi:MAG: YoaK family protein [Mycobacterium sp.]